MLSTVLVYHTYCSVFKSIQVAYEQALLSRMGRKESGKRKEASIQEACVFSRLCFELRVSERLKVSELRDCVLDVQRISTHFKESSVEAHDNVFES